MSFRKISPQEIALIFITFLWGITFYTIQKTLLYIDDMFLVSSRFLVAGFFSFLLCRNNIFHLRLYDFITSVLIGIAIFLGYGFQTIGLHSITSSQSAFITTFYVPIVPFLQWIFTKKAPKLLIWVAIAFSFLGLICISGFNLSFSDHLNNGTWITCLSAFAIALEISLVSLFAPSIHNDKNAATIQLLTAGILAFLTMPILHEKLPSFSWSWLIPILGLALLSAFVQIIVNWAQKTVSSTRATIIFAAEPLWAGIIGWIVGETFTPHFIFGAILVMMGVLICELSPKD